ncbi:MAG: hypothetical protein ACLQQ4_06925 [Bacteroidia bacterium]
MAKTFTRLKFDSVWVGLATGILLPLATFFINYLIHFRGMPLFRVFHAIRVGQMQFPLMTFCLIPDLCMFFVFLWINRERSSRGILFAILPYVIYMVWKFADQ